MHNEQTGAGEGSATAGKTDTYGSKVLAIDFFLMQIKGGKKQKKKLFKAAESFFHHHNSRTSCYHW